MVLVLQIVAVCSLLLVVYSRPDGLLPSNEFTPAWANDIQRNGSSNSDHHHRYHRSANRIFPVLLNGSYAYLTGSTWLYHDSTSDRYGYASNKTRLVNGAFSYFHSRNKKIPITRKCDFISWIKDHTDCVNCADDFVQACGLDFMKLDNIPVWFSLFWNQEAINIVSDLVWNKRPSIPYSHDHENVDELSLRGYYDPKYHRQYDNWPQWRLRNALITYAYKFQILETRLGFLEQKLRNLPQPTASRAGLSIAREFITTPSDKLSGNPRDQSSVQAAESYVPRDLALRGLSADERQLRPSPFLRDQSDVIAPQRPATCDPGYACRKTDCTDCKGICPKGQQCFEPLKNAPPACLTDEGCFRADRTDCPTTSTCPVGKGCFALDRSDCSVAQNCPLGQICVNSDTVSCPADYKCVNNSKKFINRPRSQCATSKQLQLAFSNETSKGNILRKILLSKIDSCPVTTKDHLEQAIRECKPNAKVYAEMQREILLNQTGDQQVRIDDMVYCDCPDNCNSHTSANWNWFLTTGGFTRVGPLYKDQNDTGWTTGGNDCGNYPIWNGSDKLVRKWFRVNDSLLPWKDPLFPPMVQLPYGHWRFSHSPWGDAVISTWLFKEFNGQNISVFVYPDTIHSRPTKVDIGVDITVLTQEPTGYFFIGHKEVNFTYWGSETENAWYWTDPKTGDTPSIGDVEHWHTVKVCKYTNFYTWVEADYFTLVLSNEDGNFLIHSCLFWTSLWTNVPGSGCGLHQVDNSYQVKYCGHMIATSGQKNDPFFLGKEGNFTSFSENASDFALLYSPKHGGITAVFPDGTVSNKFAARNHCAYHIDWWGFGILGRIMYLYCSVTSPAHIAEEIFWILLLAILYTLMLVFILQTFVLVFKLIFSLCGFFVWSGGKLVYKKSIGQTPNKEELYYLPKQADNFKDTMQWWIRNHLYPLYVLMKVTFLWRLLRVTRVLRRNEMRGNFRWYAWYRRSWLGMAYRNLLWQNSFSLNVNDCGKDYKVYRYTGPLLTKMILILCLITQTSAVITVHPGSPITPTNVREATVEFNDGAFPALIADITFPLGSYHGIPIKTFVDKKEVHVTVAPQKASVLSQLEYLYTMTGFTYANTKFSYGCEFYGQFGGDCDYWRQTPINGGTYIHMALNDGTNARAPCEKQFEGSNHKSRFCWSRLILKHGYEAAYRDVMPRFQYRMPVYTIAHTAWEFELLVNISSESVIIKIDPTAPNGVVETDDIRVEFKKPLISLDLKAGNRIGSLSTGPVCDGTSTIWYKGLPNFGDISSTSVCLFHCEGEPIAGARGACKTNAFPTTSPDIGGGDPGWVDKNDIFIPEQIAKTWTSLSTSTGCDHSFRGEPRIEGEFCYPNGSLVSQSCFSSSIDITVFIKKAKIINVVLKEIPVKFLKFHVEGHILTTCGVRVTITNTGPSGDVILTTNSTLTLLQYTFPLAQGQSKLICGYSRWNYTTAEFCQADGCVSVDVDLKPPTSFIQHTETESVIYSTNTFSGGDALGALFAGVTDWWDYLRIVALSLAGLLILFVVLKTTTILWSWLRQTDHEKQS